MSSNKLYGFLIVFLLSLQLGFAADLNLYQGNGPGELCPGSTGLISDVIENSGDEVTQVSLTSSGSASFFSTTVPQGFVLAPGEIRTVYTYVTPSSTTSVGEYYLDVLANSETLTHSFFVKDCFDYSLVSLESEKHVCPGEMESFNFEVINQGDYSETYELSIEGNYPGQVSLSEGLVSVSAGSTKNVEVYVSADEDSLGDYEFNLVADPYVGSAVKSVGAKLVVDPCYDFNINTEKDSISFCEHSQEIILIDLSNSGSTENVYDLELDGPSWANLENNKLTIGSQSSESVELVLSPDYGVEGNFEVNFKVTPEKGNVQAMNIFNVNVKKCHDVSIDVEKNVDTICNSLESKYNVNLVNNGEYGKDYYLELNGPDWADIDQRSISLGVGEDAQFNLIVNPGYDVTSATYAIEVFAHAKDSSKVASSDKIDVTTVTREECYKVALGVDENNVEIYSDSTATIPVIVENMGSDEAVYELSVGGTASSFVYLNPSVITLGESKSELVYLYLAPAEKVSPGKYSVSVSARLGDSTILDSQTVDILVKEGSQAVEIELTGSVVETTDNTTDDNISPFMKFIGFLKSLFFSEDDSVVDLEEIDSIVEEIIEDDSDLELIEEVNLEEDLSEDSIEEEVVQLSETQDSLMNLGEVMNFNIGEEEHTIAFEDKSEDSILIVISSDPVYVALDVGESKEVDLDSDGISDVLVTFNGFVEGQADISYEVLSGNYFTEEEVTEEEVTEEEVTEEEVTEEEVTEEVQVETEVLEDITSEVVLESDIGDEENSFLSSFSMAFVNIFTNLLDYIQEYRVHLIILIVLLILIIASTKTEFLDKVKEFFEEEIEEEAVLLESTSKKVKKDKSEEDRSEEDSGDEEDKSEEDSGDEEDKSEEDSGDEEDKKKRKKREETEEDFIIEFD